MDETIIEKIVMATGLPTELVKDQLHRWIVSTGRSPQGLNLEDLREVLIHCLQDLFCEVKAGQNEYIKITN